MESEDSVPRSENTRTTVYPAWTLIRQSSVLMHYAASRKVGGSRPDEVNFFSIYLILPAALGPGVYSACNRNFIFVGCILLR
jgi:hypothetical protein